MSVVYVFEGKVIKYGGGRYVIYPSKDYQEKLKRFHGEKVKVIVVKESD
jgi:putative transposon-encoded protein